MRFFSFSCGRPHPWTFILPHLDHCRELVGVSDWDLMMQRRKDAMARARKRRRKDIDINASDDFIMNLIGGMKMAAQEDKQLNLAGKAATKKLQMLPTIMKHLKK